MLIEIYTRFFFLSLVYCKGLKNSMTSGITALLLQLLKYMSKSTCIVISVIHWGKLFEFSHSLATHLQLFCVI